MQATIRNGKRIKSSIYKNNNKQNQKKTVA